MKKIGIIGGAGPAASALLYKKIIQSCQQNFNCSRDSDFPEIILINYPFSEMLSEKHAQKYKFKIQKELQYCFDKLNSYNADITIIACNTLHTFLGKINIGNLELIDLAQTTLKYATQQKLKKILILGTEQTVQTGLYTNKTLTCAPVNSEQQKIVSVIIDNILTGELKTQDALTLTTIIAQAITNNKAAQPETGQKTNTRFDGVILGCTELSVLIEQYTLELPEQTQKKITILDPLEIVTEKLTQKLYNMRKK
ncbi:MAG: aspartate/glutamate racemase family protein [bacterium]